MKSIKFIVEKTETGYSAYCEVPNMGIAATTGVTIVELKENALEAYNALLFQYHKKSIDLDNIFLAYDLRQFFEYYNIINTKALAGRINMNYSLLSQYITGLKTPSEKQTQKILQGVKQLGKELYEADFV